MVKIMLYDEISVNLYDKFNSVEKYFSNYFWHECAEFWNNELVHKIYCLVSDEEDEIFSFISLRVNEIKLKSGNISGNIPVLDLAYFDFSEHLSNEEINSVMRAFLEYIYLIGINISKKVGCRYIRAYIPFRPSFEDPNEKGEPYFPEMQNIFKEFEYQELNLSIQKRTRKIKDQTSELNDIMGINCYLFRDLKITN
ncbi:MAG: hypothetical protein ACTSWL_00350 [Promethearchaeota archaeon]